MPAPKTVEVPDDEYAAQKAAVADRAVEAVVAGDAGIRDCITRDIVRKGGTVHLDPTEPGFRLLVKSGAVRPTGAKPGKPADAKG